MWIRGWALNSGRGPWKLQNGECQTDWSGEHTLTERVRLSTWTKNKRKSQSNYSSCDYAVTIIPVYETRNIMWWKHNTQAHKCQHWKVLEHILKTSTSPLVFINVKQQRSTYYLNVFPVILIIIIIIIIIITTFFMQGIYTYIPETHHVPRKCRVPSIL